MLASLWFSLISIPYTDNWEWPLDRDYNNPNFPTRHLLKDTELFLDAADEHCLTASALEGVRDVVSIALAKGLGDADYSAINDVIHPPAK